MAFAAKSEGIAFAAKSEGIAFAAVYTTHHNAFSKGARNSNFAANRTPVTTRVFDFAVAFEKRKPKKM